MPAGVLTVTPSLLFLCSLDVSQNLKSDCSDPEHSHSSGEQFRCHLIIISIVHLTVSGQELRASSGRIN